MIINIKRITLPLYFPISLLCDSLLDPFPALLAMPQPLLFLIIYILSIYDILRAFRTKNIATETTVMSPSYYW